MALPETGRRVATMYDKLAANCLAFVKLAQSEFGCVLMSPALERDEMRLIRMGIPKSSRF